jgi:hypothetical protein
MEQKSKRERFEQVAGNRVQMVLERIENLSRCANKRNYEYSKPDIDRMFRAISEATKLAKIKFEAELDASQSKKKVFKF